MKLFSYFTDERQYRIGIEIDNSRYNFTQLFEFYKDIKGVAKSPELIFLQMMIELGFFNLEDITEIINTVKEFRPFDDLKMKGPVEFDVPVSRPSKILCIGRNYAAHAKESGMDVPEEPIFFAKMSSTLLPHQGKIVLPPNVGRVDHEVELGFIISKEAKNITESQAYDHIAGFTIINDISARAMQKADMSKRNPWLRSKSFDTFCPTGPFLVPIKMIPDAQNLNLMLKVNSEIRQQSNTSHMIFQIPKLVSYISKHMTLVPGDIIATGTPEGISELHLGDHVEAEIDGLGKLENEVIGS